MATQWKCNWCTTTNHIHSTYCGQCGGHWKEGTHRPKQRKPSRSRPRSKGSEHKGKTKGRGKSTTRENLMPFGTKGKAPWVQSTPTRALPPVPTEETAQAEGQPNEQLKQFQKLKAGLQVAGLEVSDELKENLEALEAALAPLPPRISHKQVTQVQRWTAKAAKIKEQIEEMDQNFQSYKGWLKEVFAEQQQLYQTTRKKLQEQLTEAITRLEDAQKDVKDATSRMTLPNTAETKEEPQELFDTDSEPEPIEQDRRGDGQKRSISEDTAETYAALRPFGKRPKDGAPAYYKADTDLWNRKPEGKD